MPILFCDILLEWFQTSIAQYRFSLQANVAAGICVLDVAAGTPPGKLHRVTRSDCLTPGSAQITKAGKADCISATINQANDAAIFRLPEPGDQLHAE